MMGLTQFHTESLSRTLLSSENSKAQNPGRRERKKEKGWWLGDSPGGSEIALPEMKTKLKPIFV